jgi:hypothetical protein
MVDLNRLRVDTHANEFVSNKKEGRRKKEEGRRKIVYI